MAMLALSEGQQQCHRILSTLRLRAGLEDPAVHLELEEREGVHHPAGQAAGGGRAWAAGMDCIDDASAAFALWLMR